MASFFRCSAGLAVLSLLAASFSVSAQDQLASAPAITAGAPSAAKIKTPFKRRDHSSEEELRKELAKVPEVGFDSRENPTIVAYLLKMRTIAKSSDPPITADWGFQTYRKITQTRNKPQEASALPWRHGSETQLSPETGMWLQENSREMRRYFRVATELSGKGALEETLDTAKLLELKTGKNQWDRPECVSTLVQILQAEGTPLRLWLVETLGKIPGQAATKALAQRAIFDLSPEVREQAVKALAARPLDEYQTVLLEGLRWPWKPVVHHAAEAIVALELKALAPDLLSLVQEVDPTLPFEKELNGIKTMHVKELVKLNHNRNCLLCHAPLIGKGAVLLPTDGLVPGAIMDPNQSPNLVLPVYYENLGPSVRADTTFLRQDFSIVEPVKNHGNWLAKQRFDYILRERRVTADEIKRREMERKNATASGELEPVMFVLNELRIPLSKVAVAKQSQRYTPLKQTSILD